MIGGHLYEMTTLSLILQSLLPGSTLQWKGSGVGGGGVEAHPQAEKENREKLIK